jgi:hypothetical protein
MKSCMLFHISYYEGFIIQTKVISLAVYLITQVKFHVISLHKLWCSMGDPNIASMHHLNMEQLTKTLSSLFNLYEANRNSNDVHENEAEFHSLYVLLNLGSHSKPMVNPYIINIISCFFLFLLLINSSLVTS